MAELLPPAKWRLTKNDGTPAANYVVHTYTTGGAVTAKATYTTADQSVSNGASVTLDARGEADIWWDGLYYIAVYKSAADGGGLLFAMDNYGAGAIAVSNVTTPTTLTTADSGKIITTTADITLPDADTAGTGWSVTIKSLSAAALNIARTTSTDSINGSVSDLTLPAGLSIYAVVNSGATGYDILLSPLVEIGAGSVGQVLQVGNAGPEWETVNLANVGGKLYNYSNFT